MSELELKSDNYRIKETTLIQTYRRGGHIEQAGRTSTCGGWKFGRDISGARSPSLTLVSSAGGRNSWSPKQFSLKNPHMDLLRLTPSEPQHWGSSLKSTSGIQGETEINVWHQGESWGTALSQTVRCVGAIVPFLNPPPTESQSQQAGSISETSSAWLILFVLPWNSPETLSYPSFGPSQAAFPYEWLVLAHASYILSNKQQPASVSPQPLLPKWLWARTSRSQPRFIAWLWLGTSKPSTSTSHLRLLYRSGRVAMGKTQVRAVLGLYQLGNSRTCTSSGQL